jgi:hypothetical protein
MSELWALAATAGIGAVAWLYQRAWDRRQLRLDRYQAFVDRLPGFTVANRDAVKMDEAYTSECFHLPASHWTPIEGLYHVIGMSLRCPSPDDAGC